MQHTGNAGEFHFALIDRSYQHPGKPGLAALDGPFWAQVIAHDARFCISKQQKSAELFRTLRKSTREVVNKRRTGTSRAAAAGSTRVGEGVWITVRGGGPAPGGKHP